MTPEELCAKCGECCCCKPHGPIMTLPEMIEFTMHLDPKVPPRDVIPLVDRPEDTKTSPCPFLSRSEATGFKCVIYPIRPASCRNYECRAIQYLRAGMEEQAQVMIMQENWSVCRRWAADTFASRFPASYLKPPSA